MQISDDHFNVLVQQAVDDIPERFASQLNNVAFLVADAPSRHQQSRSQMMHGRELLLGLYEGIPLPERNDGYSGVVPDVITVFKRAHELISENDADLAQQIHQTVWHEVAHYFGLDHGQIHDLETR